MTSCSKEDNLKENLDELSQINVLKISENFNKDYAVFKDFDEYRLFMKKYNKFSYDEQRAIVKNLRYVTFQNQLNFLYSEIDKMSSAQEMEDFVNRYNGILKLERRNGEQEIVSVGVTNHSVKPFLNKDRIIKVGDKYLKYIFDYAIESNDYNDLLGLSSVDEILNCGLKYHIASKNVETNQSLRTLGTYRKFWQTYDPSGCNSDRRITMEISFNDEGYPAANGGILWEHSLTSQAWATRRSFACWWYEYTTEITWNNFNTEYSRYFLNNTTYHTFSEPNIVEETSRITRSLIVDLDLFSTQPVYSLTKIQSFLSTRGGAAMNINL